MFIDYGGAGIAFKMGGIVKYSTEMYSYVSSFGVGDEPGLLEQAAARPAGSWSTKSITGVEKEVGEAWDGLDVAGKKALIDGGGEAIKLSPAEDAKFRKIGAAGGRGQDQGARRQGHAGARRLHHDEGARRQARQDLEELLELGRAPAPSSASAIGLRYRRRHRDALADRLHGLRLVAACSSPR